MSDHFSRGRLRAWLAGLVVCASAGCGDTEPDVARCIDLLERLDPSRVSPALAAELDEKAIVAGAMRLFEGTLAEAVAANGGVHVGDWFAPLLGVPAAAGGEQATLSVAALPMRSTRPMQVLVDLERPLGPREMLFTIEVYRAFEVGKLGDREFMIRVLRDYSVFLRRLSVGSDPLRAATLVLPETMASEATTLLVGALTFGEPLGAARLRAHRLTERQGWLLESGPAQAHALLRPVEVDGVTRPSAIAAVPASFQWEVDLPEGATFFRAWLAVLWDDSSATFSFTARASVGSETRERRSGVEGIEESWIPIELPLSPFAGKRAKVELILECDDPRGQRAIAVVARPRIEVDGDRRAPDVILVSLDTVRADRTSLHGFHRKTTPHLVELAGGAAVFDNSIAAAPWTLPSHASMLSGLLPDRHGATSATSRVPTAAPWLASDFRAAGYHTVAITGGGFVSPEFGFDRGFDAYGVIDPAEPSIRIARRTGDPASIYRAQASLDARRALVDLIEGPRTRPLFLFVHTYAAHNYAAPADVLSSLGATPDLLPGLLEGASTERTIKVVKSEVPESEKEAAKERARFLYDASVRVADDLVGTIVAALQRSGRLDSTILVITSDHGEELFEHGGMGHIDTLYEELVRVPFVVRASGLAARRIDDVVSSVDLAPTIRELAGLPPVDTCDGRSLVPLLKGETLAPAPAIARGSSRSKVFRALRGSNLKLIEETGFGAPRRELYDLAADPKEARNLAAEKVPALEALATALAERVAALQAAGLPVGDEAVTDASLRANLRELGYLGGAGD